MLALIVVGMAAAVYLLVSQHPSGKIETPFSSSAERDAIAADFADRIRTFRQEAESRRDVPAVLEANQRELNAYLQASPNLQAKLRSKGVSNPSVKLERNRIIATGDVFFRGVKSQVTITGLVVANSQDSLTFQLQTCRAGKLGMPRIVTARIASKVQEMIESGDLKVPPEVSSVRIEDGKLIVTASPGQRRSR